MTALVTLAELKAHLKRPSAEGPDDADLTAKAEQATDIVIGYIGDNADEDWTDETVPGRVKAAILLVAGNLYRFRGDEETPAPPALTERVMDVLYGYRDPTLA